MRYARLGSSGLQVSRIGLGMMSYGDPAQVGWFLPEDAAEPIVRRAVEAGVTFFDTADLSVDYIDLYQVHRWDDATPIEETMSALADLVQAGKVRYLGASLMRTWQFAKAQHIAPVRFVSMQTRYHLAFREEEREMIPFCVDQGVGVLPYSPLARGLLARTGGESVRASIGDGDRVVENDLEVVAALRAVAADRGVPPAQVALAWLLGNPAVSAPIVGVTKPAQLDDALAAVDLHLTDDEVARIELPYRAHEPYGYN